MNDDKVKEAYEAHHAGELWRDAPIGFASGRVTIKPYGWLRGFTVALAEPLPNMDASNPYEVIITIQPHRGEALSVPLTIQAICEPLEPLGEGHVSSYPELLSEA